MPLTTLWVSVISILFLPFAAWNAWVVLGTRELVSAFYCPCLKISQKLRILPLLMHGGRVECHSWSQHVVRSASTDHRVLTRFHLCFMWRLTQGKKGTAYLCSTMEMKQGKAAEEQWNVLTLNWYREFMYISKLEKELHSLYRII